MSFVLCWGANREEKNAWNCWYDLGILEEKLRRVLCCAAWEVSVPFCCLCVTNVHEADVLFVMHMSVRLVCPRTEQRLVRTPEHQRCFHLNRLTPNMKICILVAGSCVFCLCSPLYKDSTHYQLQQQQHTNTHTQAHTHTVLPIRNSLLSLITFIFSGLEFPLSVPEEMDFFPPLPTCRKSLTHITLAPRSKQVSWLVLLYILWFNKENTNVSQREQCWWYQCHAFHWFLFTWCPQDTRWLVALHTWPGNFVHLTGSRRVLWRSEKRQRDKN